MINISVSCLWLQLTENLTHTGLDFNGHLLPHVTERCRDYYTILLSLDQHSYSISFNFLLAQPSKCWFCSQPGFSHSAKKQFQALYSHTTLAWVGEISWVLELLYSQILRYSRIGPPHSIAMAGEMEWPSSKRAIDKVELVVKRQSCPQFTPATQSRGGVVGTEAVSTAGDTKYLPSI